MNPMKTSLCAGLCVIVSGFMLGCGNDRYALEREYWHLRKQSRRILNNSGSAAFLDTERVIALLSAFSRKNSGTDLAIDGEMEIARLHAVRGDFSSVNSRLEDLFKRCPSPETKAEILFLRGTIAEQASRWNEGLQWYKRIMNEYPETVRGMAVPLYIARHYRSSFQPREMMEAYRQAIEHYRRITELRPGSGKAFESYAMVYSCYSELKNWKLALETLAVIAREFEGKVPLDEVLLNMAMIYRQELNDAAAARGILKRLVREYPESPFKKTAQAMLNG